MNDLFYFLPDVSHEEMYYLEKVTENYDQEKVRRFAISYRAQRRDPMVILLCTLIGFVWIAGIQRFMTNQIGMGILYLLTGGLCFIGTLVDLVNYQKLTLEYNRQVAVEVASFLR